MTIYHSNTFFYTEIFTDSFAKTIELTKKFSLRFDSRMNQQKKRTENEIFLKLKNFIGVNKKFI